MYEYSAIKLIIGSFKNKRDSKKIKNIKFWKDLDSEL